MDSNPLPRTWLRTPHGVTPLSRPQKIAWAFLGSLLAPAYWLAAHRYQTPGLHIHLDCARLGLGLLFRKHAPLPFGWIHQMVFWPFDSTRYFEFDFMSRMSLQSPVQRYLDISSPRLFPILMLCRDAKLTAEMINPDQHDLRLTAQFINAAGLATRCHVHPCTIEAAPFATESFDLITCMSVLEHIPHDMAAVQKMWGLLAHQGRLLLTVPCAAAASEQYIDHNEYRLLSADAEGFVFWQRFYDPTLLRERLFSVLGEPVRCEVYGETVAGAFQKNATQKRSNPFYPYWREPYMMGQEYARFASVEALPGEGVVALEFVKP